MAQGRRVRRVIRRIDPWSVLKVSALFWASLCAVVVLAGVMLWIVGSAIGVVDNVENVIEGVLGFKDFSFAGGQLLRALVGVGIMLSILGSGFAVFVAVIYNLISDIVGGIQLTVLEEEPVRAIAPTNGAPARPNGALQSAAPQAASDRSPTAAQAVPRSMGAG